MAETDSTAVVLPTEQLSRLSFEDVERKYRDVCIGSGEQGLLGPASFVTPHAVDLLLAIERDPRIAGAVAFVQYHCGDDDMNLKEDRDDDRAPEWHGAALSESNLASLQTHPADMLDMISLTSQERLQWRADLEIGSHSATFAVLLTRLPNLKTISLVGFGETWKPYLDKIFNHASTNPGTTILAKLTEAHASHYDNEFGEDIEVIDELILIPSLKKFSAHMLGDIDAGEYQCLQTKNGDTRTSNVEEVEFTHSQLDHNDIAEFLKPMVNLKRMDYDCMFDWSIVADCEIEEFREEFKDVAGDMLEQRGMIWKANKENLVIRKKEFAGEVDDFDENK